MIDINSNKDDSETKIWLDVAVFHDPYLACLCQGCVVPVLQFEFLLEAPPQKLRSNQVDARRYLSYHTP